MKEQNLHTAELLGVLEDIMDSIWLINLADHRVEILHNYMIPEMAGVTTDYEEVYAVYLRDYVYPADREKWQALMSIMALKEISQKEKRKVHFDMRFRNESFGFEWHQVHLNVLFDEAGSPDRVLLTSRYVNNLRKGEIVTKAVEGEYDYVVYIEADKNSYVMYTSNSETGTPVPPVASNDYELEVAEFHRRHVLEEYRDSLTEQLSIAHVQPILEKTGEYVVYCNDMVENGVLRDKKLRFSYFDREKNIWLLTRTDITEIKEEKRQKQLLQDALDAATAANRAKSEFLSRMSHDIRTPMNAIIGMTAIAGAHIADQDRVADCLTKITSSSKLLLGLINEVLDMAKVESGNIVLAEEKIEMAALVESVINMIQPSIDRKKQFFEAHIGGVKDEMVIGDSQRLQQVLLNLLSNATKYTPEGGHIVFEIKEQPFRQPGVGCYEFSVMDDGIGMKEAFLENLFEPFERADDAFVRSVPGTGLGMAISKNIIEMMGGTMQVESTYGCGSKFSATFSLRLQDQPEWETCALVGLPILIVDDDEIICEDVCQRLNNIGMDGEYTLCGKEAVKKVVDSHNRGRDYFAVIIDMRMPEMDGIETTRQIRARVGTEVPIIMISAYDWSEYEDEAIEAGVNGFIVKPLFQSRLIYKLNQLVHKEPACKQRKYPPLPQGDFGGKRVLLAEDNALNREIARELLSAVGLQVDEAENGKIAVDMVRERPEHYYDLILMDMQMPVMDGCTAVKTIRQLKRADVKRMPIIAMTANAFADDVEKTRAAGMDEHLSKPIDMEVLSQTLAKWLV